MARKGIASAANRWEQSWQSVNGAFHKAAREGLKCVMRMHKYYLGFGFEVWTSQRAWFWRLLRPDRDGGTIGVAGSEGEAVRDACASIEECNPRFNAIDGRVTMSEVGAPMFRRCVSIPLAAIHWNESLARLESYLASVRGANA
jgi:hypothetical protein